MTLEDVTTLVAELHAYPAHFRSALTRPEQALWAHDYLRGLLSDQPRKSIEPIALALGLKRGARQAFRAESRWDTIPVLKAHQQLVAQTLGEADRVLLIFESGLPKQRQQSVGVAPQ